MPTKSVITFINHASVTIASNNINLLCDPWFSGDVFHKGWNLLVENSDEQIKELLKKITHIWISHEHPDHFSIKFFNTFTKLIKERGITILFQETKDKRVEKFLLNKNFSFIKLPFN
ncbi:MAG: MBL fold metallo-hydrolase, partial [Methylophilaceae bacterium]